MIKKLENKGLVEIILIYIWKFTFPGFTIPVIIEVIIWISAIVRIVICMFPQNNWCTDEGNMKLSVIRNSVFSKTKPKVGLLMIPKTCAYMWIIAMGLQLLF